jgi:tryptophan synthase alpha chain
MVDVHRAQVEQAFDTARAEGRTLLLPYLTAGLPTPEESVDLFVAMADAGADGFEIGIPYSDPLMDGPTIHEAGLAALAAGATFERSLGIVEQVVSHTGLPVFVMTYANPVLNRGPEAYAARVAEAGAAGLIVADLPVDEAGRFESAAARSGLGLVLFVAPTTDDERLQRVIEHQPVFIYGVARLGVTGEQRDIGGASQLAELSRRVRAQTDLPLVAGVGISTPAMAAEAAEYADGVIVGSALVRRVLDATDVASASHALHAAVLELAAAVRR